ncbi:hypothetical protein [Leifsonia sp. AG29]|uniref:hypothetical protein n=1 Tax=Leifsonia sp. AG29 TaxID=2598860 RepID=UPI00131D9178|nr:hypothetical protein [Leifsonia sp. AG29]
MTVQLLANAILIVLLLAWVGYRQLTWRPVAVSRLWRFPAVLAAVGAIVLVQEAKPVPLTPLDLAAIAGELLLSLAVGAWMGRIAAFRPLPEPIRMGPDGRDVAVYESRTGGWGLALWIVVIAVRVGVDLLASAAGSHLVASTGVIFLLFAANRAARAAVSVARLDRHAAVASGRSDAA